LCGHDKEERLGPRGVGETAGQRDAVIEPHAGQEGTFAGLLQPGGMGGVGLPDGNASSGAQAGQRQRRPPGAGSDDPDTVESHCCNISG